MYEQELKELGLTDNEVRIYLLLLQSGILNPYKIAEKLGLHRGYVYDALERMSEKGVVSIIHVDNKAHYQAAPPETIVELFRLKLQTLEGIVPALKKLQNVKKEDTTVHLHKGSRVYATLLKDMIATARGEDTLLLGGIDEEFLEQIEPIYLKQYLALIKERKIKERVIIPIGSKRLAGNIEYRELDARYIGNTAQAIYGNKVALFVKGTPFHLIIIENQEVVKTYKAQFEVLWKLAKK